MANVSVAEKASSDVKPVCGIIMPISAMLPKYEASHWSDVRKVFDAAIMKAGMTPQIVSDSFEGDVIQQRIISNLYDNPVVICDVSGLNPNVMFELGMRITFKQPVIIVTDDFSTIPFDTKVIEHLGYPRDLHIHLTNDFINKLSDKITSLHSQKKAGTFKSFIEAFGTFEILEPTKKIVEADRLILDRIEMLDDTINRLMAQRDRDRVNGKAYRKYVPSGLRIHFGDNVSDDELNHALNKLKAIIPQSHIHNLKRANGESLITLDLSRVDKDSIDSIESIVRNVLSGVSSEVIIGLV